MGIATGVLKEGVSPSGSIVLELAKLVSDAASGGQVLMCQETFRAVKDVVGELGSVNEEGISEASSSAAWNSCLAWLRQGHPSINLHSSLCP